MIEMEGASDLAAADMALAAVAVEYRGAVDVFDLGGGRDCIGLAGTSSPRVRTL
jgi:hypothetical protein